MGKKASRATKKVTMMDADLAQAEKDSKDELASSLLLNPTEIDECMEAFDREMCDMDKRVLTMTSRHRDAFNSELRQ